MRNVCLANNLVIQNLRNDEFEEIIQYLDPLVFGDVKKENLTTSFLYSIKQKDSDEIIAIFGIEEFDKFSLCLFYLFVKKAFRRQGIAQNVISAIVKAFPEKLYIYGFVNPANSNAIEFYKKHYVFLSKDGRHFTKNLDNAITINNEYEVIFKY